MVLLKTVIIFYEHVSREYDACVNLKTEIEKQSDVEVFIYSFQFQVLDSYLLSLKRKIDMIVIPYAYKESSILPIAALINKTPKPYILNLHHEQIGGEFNEHRLFPVDDYTKNHIIHLVWTNWFKEKLIKEGINENLIYVTGNIRTDILINNPQTVSKEKLAGEFNIDPLKRWILLCESGTAVLSTNRIDDLANRDYYKNGGYKRENLILRNHENKKAFDETLLDMSNLGDSFFDKYEIIYRAHPGTSFTKNIDNRIKVIDKYTIYDWFNVVDLNISRLSTSLFESEMCNVATLRYNPTDYPKVLQTFGLENYRELRSLSLIDDNLIELAKQDLKGKQVYDKYLGIADGLSTKRVSGVMADLLNLSNKYYPRNAIKIKYHKFLIRKILSNIISRLIFIYKLKSLGKLSNSSSVSKNDIPPSWN